MTTTTRKTPETDKVVRDPAADPAAEQQGKAISEAAPVGTLPRATGEAQPLTPRGRQRTPKPWLSAVMCRLGMHEGPWAYVAEGNCTYGRECRRCGSVHARTRHWHVWRYIGELTCEQVLSCRRCDAANGERTSHQRGWRYLRESTCEQERKCGRCGDANGERTSHEWGEDYQIETRWWQGSREGHRCRRCGAEEEWNVDCGD